MSRRKAIMPVSVANSGDSVSRIPDCGVNDSTIDSQAFPSPHSPESVAYRDLLGDLKAALAPLQTLHQQAVEAYAPTVREILRNGSRDARLIEHTLDHLLDHACIPQGLALFKSLCRHYWNLNTHATASYINAYREMWDSDDTNETEEEP
jgi:hypothetical protein